jgi:starch synthase
MEPVRILFVSQEITPYLPETHMSVTARNLPQGIQDRGREIRTFMPRFGCVNERRNQLHEVIRLSGMNLIINDTDHPLIIKVASIQSARMQVYFIDNDDFFHRKATLTDENGAYFEDNDERAIFFARGVIETVRKLRWSPDIVHCHGWFTSLLPMYLKKYYADDPLFAGTKVVTSIYDDAFPKPLDFALKSKLLWDEFSEEDVQQIADPTYDNLLKLAVDFSDAAIQASETISKEVVDYINTQEKLFLPYQNPEGYIDEYNTFYNKVLELGK